MNIKQNRKPSSPETVSNNDTIPICHISDITEGAGLNCYHKGQPLLAIRQGSDVFVYHNSCPHLHIPLEWQEHQFLNHDRSLIQCSTHGALFTIDEGECISGPCSGSHLKSVAINIDKGHVFASPESTTSPSHSSSI